MFGMAGSLTEAQEIINIAPTELVLYFVNSVLAGLLLSLVTIWAMSKLPSVPETLSAQDPASLPPGSERPPTLAQLKKLTQLESRINAFTVLFLCIGMTGVMVLVSNSLARAFAVGAAISLVRFRIRLDKPGLSTALFFAVLVGMSCGVGHIVMAWVVTGLFAMIQGSLVGLSTLWLKNEMPADEVMSVQNAPLVMHQPPPTRTNPVPEVEGPRPSIIGPEPTLSSPH
jgi:hypothetical protein